jgi:hypothetical protein
VGGGGQDDDDDDDDDDAAAAAAAADNDDDDDDDDDDDGGGGNCQSQVADQAVPVLWEAVAKSPQATQALGDAVMSAVSNLAEGGAFVKGTGVRSEGGSLALRGDELGFAAVEPRFGVCTIKAFGVHHLMQSFVYPPPRRLVRIICGY